MSDKPTTSDGTPREPRPRGPSMLGETSAEGGPHKQLSILAAIDGRPPASAGSSPRRSLVPAVAAVVFAAAALVAVWTWRTQPRGEAATPAELMAAPARGNPSAVPLVPTAAMAPAALPTAVAAAGAASTAIASGTTASKQVAAIEDLPTAAPVPAAAIAAGPGPAAPSGPSGISAAPVTPAVKTAAKPAATQHAARHNADRRRLAKAKSKPVVVAAAARRSTTAATNTPANAPATASAAMPVAGAAALAKNSAPGTDADVELLTALMQHMNRDSSGRTVPSPQGETTIASLVARCKVQAGNEALSCQRKICENYWGRAEACPRSLAPSSERRAQSESPQPRP